MMGLCLYLAIGHRTWEGHSGRLGAVAFHRCQGIVVHHFTQRFPEVIILQYSVHIEGKQVHPGAGAFENMVGIIFKEGPVGCIHPLDHIQFPGLQGHGPLGIILHVLHGHRIQLRLAVPVIVVPLHLDFFILRETGDSVRTGEHGRRSRVLIAVLRIHDAEAP